LVDDYFLLEIISNVDFYSGIIYRALGIPTDMFTVLFAIGRLQDGCKWRNAENKEPIGGRNKFIWVYH
jgi:citrate synthase